MTTPDMHSSLSLMIRKHCVFLVYVIVPHTLQEADKEVLRPVYDLA